MDLPATFIALADQLAEFRGTHGRFPAQCDARDAHERVLGDFLRAQRRARVLHQRGQREGSVTERMHHLDLVAPGWRVEGIKPAVPREMVPFSRRVMECREFMNTNGGRLPGARSTDQHERVLGRFLDNVRQARKGRGTVAWDQTREAMMGREVPGWDFEDAPSFDRRTAELREFVQRTGRAPRRLPGRYSDLPEAERNESSLAVFVSLTRTKGSVERRALLTGALGLAA